MSTFKNPVGPQPSKVYWRRRLIVGLGVLAVIVIIILIVTRPGSSPTKSASATHTQSSSSSIPATSKDGAACLPSNIKLEAITDKTTYAASEKPLISMKITNTGTAACSMNLGSTQQELKITSGSETYWDSKDCQTGAVDAPTVLKAGQALSTPTITWDRTRSSTTTCSASRPPVTAGGASYHLTVKVGDITSKETAQFLLN